MSTSLPRPPGLLQHPGLTQIEATARLHKDGPNVLPASRPRPLWVIALHVLAEPMFAMLLVAGGLYFALGDRAEAIFLLAFVLVIIGITLLEERKTQRVLEALRDLSAPMAAVIRDGNELRIPSWQVVVGDLLSLREGDRVAADARMLIGGIDVDESLLTGESVPVTKTTHADAMTLYAGTLVTKGRGYAQACATAADTAIGHIGSALASTSEATSRLQTSSRVLIRRFAMLALLLSAALFLLNWLWDGHNVLTSLLSAIALAMSILPEEIPVILTVFLALGAWRMARQKILTRRIPAIETLGSITVLAVDKTGTLTQNRMRIAELRTKDAHFKDEGAPPPTRLNSLMQVVALATPPDSFDPMEQAITRFTTQWLGNGAAADKDRRPAKEYPIDPSLLVMTRAFAIVPDESRFRLYAKGAPEAVLTLCALSSDERDAIERQVAEMAAQGLRVIAAAEAEWQGSPLPDNQRSFAYRFAGLVGLIDPPRPEVPTAIAECHDAGIRLIMLTGDHPVTALAIARNIGLSPMPRMLTGADIEALSDPQLADVLCHTDVCARLQPMQKLRLVKVLQGRGEVVGMTGDGVNDAPALKAADVGVAMGQRGTDVAREAAALVLLDDNFASLMQAIRQGRRIYDNITKATRFTVAVHVPIVALALIPSLLHWPILLMPVQIVLLELLIDPACSIVFESIAEAPAIMQRPPRAVRETPFRLANLAQGAAQGTGLACVLLLGDFFALQHHGLPEQGRAAVFIALLAGVILLTLANVDPTKPLWTALRSRNPWLFALPAVVLVMLTSIVILPSFRALLGMGLPDAMALARMAAMLALSLLWLELLRLFNRQGPSFKHVFSTRQATHRRDHSTPE